MINKNKKIKCFFKVDFLTKSTNKKGLMTFEMMAFIPRLMFLAIFVFISMLFISMMIKDTVDTSQAEVEITTQRLLYSPNAISYCSAERCYPGVIDLKLLQNQTKFQERMNRSMNTQVPRATFKLELVKINATDQKTVGPLYYNKETYEIWNSLSKTYPKQFPRKQKELYVLYREGKENKPGILNLTMIMEVG